MSNFHTTSNMEKRKPLKAKNLKVIDYIGSLYATFNGSSMWKLEKVAFSILRMCDGKWNTEQIINEVAKKSNLKVEDVEPIVKEILNELTKSKFIEWIE